MQNDKIDIEISEVGPRDGLQSIAEIMPTGAKKAWIRAEAAAGVREIEVGSFVPAKILPQLADTAELVRYARNIEGLVVAVLVPNLRGAQAALEAGAHKISIPFSVSETHCQRNVNRSHQQMFEEIERIITLMNSVAGKRPHFEVGLSTAFGCSIEGPIAESKVVAIAEKLVALGVDEVGLSDTTGSGNPLSNTNLGTLWSRKTQWRTFTQYPGPRLSQCLSGRRLRFNHHRQLAGRYRRLPSGTGRKWQYRNRGFGLYA